MNIVVLDGFTMNPGDLSWDNLRKLGAVTLYERTPKELVAERLRGAEIALTNKVVLDAGVLEQLPALKYIGVCATGYNCVEIEAARKRGIVVTNVPTYGTAAVAQATFALLLELTNAVGEHARTVRDGRWSANPDFCYWVSPQVELAGLTLGLIGYGRIGRAVATIAKAMGMDVIVHTRTKSGSDERWVDLDTVFASSDVISLHCPLTPETKQIVNAKRLSEMKRSAFLINTSRGALIDDAALADALNREVIAGAALDVLTVEPPPKSNPLLSARHCIVTPHIAWATRASRSRLLNMVIENVAAFQAGTPRNKV